ncbi:enoyl-CoA hydratase/isomerase [Eremomyces bilateralis CBS 781.70]|uniref:Enoyl-CoA hydratase/isomerase n=1 Tax=Eremomyces bilateralis CBS 781.70 TaxID=1392243 RepID=A0A6G1GH41_9PEZI|nr:enoyl-CoA hydratase/isomerase [Eremomyces bilateralis CBS 781.70]KAF1817189.1 enoyl-CoA hydratase/isomerase [Eremomyces bilateralis CBS 781.70]
MTSELLATEPPQNLSFLKLSFPADRVLLVTMNRPKDLNCISRQGSTDMQAVFTWFDAEPNLTVAILTGAGRAFSAGADLKEWNTSMSPGSDSSKRLGAPGPKPFSRRLGKKPVIAAVNGLAAGGGTEFAINCDLIVASEKATFALPEVKRGVSPFAGVLPRLIRIVGLQRASEFALTGRTMSSQEAFTWGFVNQVVPQDQVMDAALKYATMISENSPDSIICTRAGLRQGWETASVDDAAEITVHGAFAKLLEGENVKEGLRAFAEKRKPSWKPSRL